MAETSTADILRERDAPPDPALIGEPRTSFSAVAADQFEGPLREAYEKRRETGAATVRAADAKAADMAPRLDAAERRIADVTSSAEARIPKPPALTAPPPQGLRPFLAPSQGEPPETSIAKFLTAIGTFGAGIGGLARGDARAGLASLTGALQGWHDGDKERADRAFKEWRAQTDAALAQWETERAGYDDWLKSANLSVDGMMKGLTLSALKHDNAIAAKAFESNDMDAALKYLGEQQAHADAVTTARARIIESHEQRERDRELKREIAESNAALRLEIEEGRRADKAKELETAAAAYDNPETLTQLGRDYVLDKKFPPNIARGKSGQTIIPKIVAAGIQWARDQGMNPDDIPHLRADIKSAQTALGDIKKRGAVAEVAVRTFDRHMDQLVALGKKVPRSEMPLVNTAVVNGQSKVAGSPDAANFVALAYEAAQEFAKVSVGTAQGDASSREEARKAISVALNQGQLESVAATLKQAAHSRMDQYRETEQRLLDTVRGPKAAAVKADEKKPGGERKRIVITNGTERLSVFEDAPWQAKYPTWKRE